MKFRQYFLITLGVIGSGRGWHDLAVAVVMGLLALSAARSVTAQARAELRLQRST